MDPVYATRFPGEQLVRRKFRPNLLSSPWCLKTPVPLSRTRFTQKPAAPTGSAGSARRAATSPNALLSSLGRHAKKQNCGREPGWRRFIY